MSLRHALLALLEAGAMTGYELAKWFDQSVAYVWNAQHSQIYTELRKLEREGLVEARTLPRGEKALATKRAYTLTRAGAKELQRWVGEVEQPPPLRDTAYVKATYLEYGSFSEARAQFRAHRAHYEALRDQFEAHVDELERGATALLRRRLERAPEEGHQAIIAYKVHAYRGLVARARTEIAWAERGLELVDRLADAAPAGDAAIRPPSGEAFEI
ncbi:PadR family transcriptional regulator [Actinomadura darangshiensis]|uniref:PadR family transcriptional regulator n=1 Tax=Actinomadura darangshiensis TaxID=705336 RepID=A0A4V2YSJ2_9ACTN|nr:PadR family transcriptional regulator [Actinomadura darangshiensis]TDD70317.1 PadR family transcriptional regulator [Actinomadura darangshiensis]